MDKNSKMSKEDDKKILIVPKTAEEIKICPIGGAYPSDRGWLRPPCCEAQCMFWDSEDKDCAIKVISDALNDAASVLIGDIDDGESWKDGIEGEDDDA